MQRQRDHGHQRTRDAERACPLHQGGGSSAARAQRDDEDDNGREQGRMKLHFAMKTRALLTGIAAVFLATGAAHAEEKLDDSWWTDCRHGWITKQFKAELMQDDPPVEITNTSVRITYDELRKLLKDLPRITRAL